MRIAPRISPGIESIKKKRRIFIDIWSRRIEFVTSQLISMRLSYGRSHEGEFGLMISKFVKETFRSISITRKIEKISRSDLGKSYVIKLILDNLDREKKRIILSKLIKIKDEEGIDFIEGIRGILKSNLSKEEYEKIDKILGRRLSHLISDSKGSIIFDPIDSKMYSINQEGFLEEKNIDPRNFNDLIELMSYGLLDKRKDLYSEYCEWKMLKIIEDAELKGLSGKNLGLYLHSRILEEMEKDPFFLRAFQFYLVKHYEQLEKSKNAMIAFGDILIAYAKIQKRMMAAATRAMGSIPFFGSIADAIASMGESLLEIGDRSSDLLRKKRSDSSKYHRIEIKPNRLDEIRI